MRANIASILATSSLLLAAALAATGASAAPAANGRDIGLARVSATEIAQMRGMTADYVRTPYGYFHASCVQRVDPSEQLQADGNILRADGMARQVSHCAFPHYLKSGVRVEATEDAIHLPQVYNGYLQLVSATLARGVNKLTAYMTVPADPVTKSGQTLYFFPGLEDANNVVTILQPVLGWSSYGTNEWTIASWNCCKSGTIYVGNSVVVKPGDRIYGRMIRGAGQKWTVVATDRTQTSLAPAVLNTSGYFQVFNWVFGGALETYGVSSCSQFPADGSTHFTTIRAYIDNALVSNPAWTIQPGNDKETACTSARVVNQQHVRINY